MIATTETKTQALDTADLEALLDRIADAFEVEAKPILAEAIRVDTVARQAQGIDASGSEWPGYTAEYAKVRKSKGLQTNYVDHRVTGTMLGSYTFDASVSMLTVPDALKPQAEGTSDRRNWIEPSVEALETGAVKIVERLNGVE